MPTETMVHIKDSIATRLMKTVFVFYLLLSIAVTLVHMVVDFKETKGTLEQDILDFETIFQPSLAAAMWNMNDVQVNKSLEGILTSKSVVGVKVLDDNGQILAARGIFEDEAGRVMQHQKDGSFKPLATNQLTTGLFYHEFPLEFFEDDQVFRMGEATIYSSTVIVLDRVRTGFTLLIINAVVKSIALWVIFLVASRKLLSKPLAYLTRKTQEVDFNNLENIIINVRTRGRNELKLLEEAFNDMVVKLAGARQTVHNSLEKLSRANRRLEKILSGMKNMVSAKDKYNAMIRASNSVLAELPVEQPAKAFIWFQDEGTLEQANYSCFEIMVDCSRTDNQVLSLDSIQDVVHSYNTNETMVMNEIPVERRTSESYLEGNTLVMPIWHDLQLLGLIKVENVHQFTAEDKEFVDILAQCLTISLEDITFNFELMRAKDQLEKLNRNLEILVEKRTKALEESSKELEVKNQQLEILSTSLSKYLSPQLYHSIFRGEKQVSLASQRKKLTIFFSDIQGFTSISESMEPEATTHMLNEYLNAMSLIALKYGGTIDKFMGDGIMIFYGDPDSRGYREDSTQCVAMAIEMREYMKVLRHRWESQGVANPLHIRMGIHTGYCTVGNFGSEQRLDYTIIGAAVNLASRLESRAQADQILISEETHALVGETIHCMPHVEMQVKGSAHTIRTFQVVDHRVKLAEQLGFVHETSEGFQFVVDFERLDEQDQSSLWAELQKAQEILKESTPG